MSASADWTLAGLKVWDVETGECVATLKGHDERVRSSGVRFLYFCDMSSL